MSSLCQWKANCGLQSVAYSTRHKIKRGCDRRHEPLTISSSTGSAGVCGQQVVTDFKRCNCVSLCLYWLLFLRNRAEETQVSDWTILEGGAVLSSTDDVITMEMLSKCSIQRRRAVNQKTWQRGGTCRGRWLSSWGQVTVLVGTGHCPRGDRSLSSGGVNPRLYLKRLHPNQSKGTVFSGSCFVYIVPVVSKATNILYEKHVS